MYEYFKLNHDPMPRCYGERKLRIYVEPLYEYEELTDEDVFVSGDYHAHVPRYLTDELAIRAAMLAFHSQVPINVPGDFEYFVFDDATGEQLYLPEQLMELSDDEEEGLVILGGPVHFY